MYSKVRQLVLQSTTSITKWTDYCEVGQCRLPDDRYFSRSSPSEVFLGKGFLKICSKFTGEHLCRLVISVKLQSSFIEIVLREGCSPVNLLHIFRKIFPKNTSWGCFCFSPRISEKLTLCYNYKEQEMAPPQQIYLRHSSSW